MLKRCISKGWKFADFPIGAAGYTDVDLPHDYSIGKPRDPKGDPLNGYFPVSSAQYVKYLTPDADKHYILDVDGAYSCAEVTWNEELLFLHPHGYTPFLVDLSDGVIPGIRNKLKITTNPLPHSTRWFHGAGLYRDVFLWEGGDVRIEPWDMFVYTENVSEQGADVVLKFTVSADRDADVVLHFAILREDVAVKEEALALTVKRGKTECRHTIGVTSPALWDVDNPNLYVLNAEIREADAMLDATTLTFGIRSVQADVKKGLLFNGKPLKLRGGCIHHDHGALGAAAFPAAEERKILALKAAGFNAVRIAHNPPSLALLEVCDRVGMIVMDEAFDIWNKRKLDVTADYHIFFKEWWDRDIAAMVKRDRNHPCVISYSIGNEIYEIDGTSEAAVWSRRLADEVRRYDDTKFVTSAIQKITLANFRAEEIDPEEYRDYMTEKRGNRDQRRINRITESFEEPLDIIGFNYHHDHFALFHDMYPDKIIWGAENWTKNIYDDWQDVVNNSYVIGDFTWTAIDNLGEVGHGAGYWEREKERYAKGFSFYPWRTCYQGDLDLCAFRRPQSYYREAVWFGGDAPRMFVTDPAHYGEGYYGTGWHWADVHDSWTFDDRYIGCPIQVDTYICADRVVWLVNGKQVGEAVPKKAIATLHTVYEKGEITAIAYRGGREISRYSLKTIGDAAALTVAPVREELKADRRDLCYFDIAAVDKDGNVDVHNESEVYIRVCGAELLGIYSANPISEDRFGENRCHLFKGRALAVIRAALPGGVTVEVMSEGLTSGCAAVTAV